MDLSILRRTAAEIAAAALVEAYPNVELLGGGETATGFFYHFHIPHPIHLHAIEEKMRQIIREKRPIRTLEMVAFSAREFLLSQGQPSRAEEAGEGLVELIQIGSFHDLSAGPHLKNTAELAAFKITLEGSQIVGWCHQSKEELKKYLKHLDAYADPLQLGEQMGFWRGGVWLAQGLQMRQKLIQFLKKQLFTDAFEVSGESEDPLELHRSMGRPKVAEIAHLGPWETRIQVSFFGPSQGEVTSCLQSIGKTLTILGFDHSAASKGGETDYEVEDGLGKRHPIVRVKRVSKKGSTVVDLVVAVVVEEVLALLLEKNLMMVELENQ